MSKLRALRSIDSFKTEWSDFVGKVKRRIPTPSRWLRRPRHLPAETCLFVTLAVNGRVPDHAIHHARAWQTAGFGVVLIVVSGDYPHLDLTGLEFADGILIRRNRGYDFGAWADAIRRLRKHILKMSVLATANDSVFGPFASFDRLISDMRRRDDDLIGLTDSYEWKYHFQSYLLFFKQGALRAPAFWKFWLTVRPGGREFVIEYYELNLHERLTTAGLRASVLFPASPDDVTNQTLAAWPTLVDAGYPYLKAMLLRDNPYRTVLSGWRDRVAEAGYDPCMIDRYLDQRGLKVAPDGQPDQGAPYES